MQTLKRNAFAPLAAVGLAVLAASSGLAADLGPTAASRDPGDGFLAELGLTGSPTPHRSSGAAEAESSLYAGVVASTPIDPPSILVLAAAEAPPTMPPALFAYPHVSGLADYASDERAVPLGGDEVLSLGPGAFTRIMSGDPGIARQWANAGETAISYIRPHMNVQMVLSLAVPGNDEAVGFEGPGFAPTALLVVDHRPRVRSSDLGSGTSQFGLRPEPPNIEEPKTAVAVGLDLGLLPTFLAQMGLNLSVVASRGQESGDWTVALVGTSEVPVDWAPPEKPRQHPVGVPVNPLANADVGYGYHSAGVGGGGPPGGNGEQPPTPITPVTPVTPITPVIPEPTSILLVAGGLLAASLFPRRKRRR